MTQLEIVIKIQGGRKDVFLKLSGSKFRRFNPTDIPSLFLTHLLEMTSRGAQEDDRVVSGGGGGDGREEIVERQNRNGRDRLLAAEGRVHVETAEVLPDGLQFLRRKTQITL